MDFSRKGEKKWNKRIRQLCKCHPGEAQISNYASVWSARFCDLRVYTLFIIDGLPEKGGNAFWIQVLLLLIIIFSYMQHYISFILRFFAFVFVFCFLFVMLCNVSSIIFHSYQLVFYLSLCLYTCFYFTLWQLKWQGENQIYKCIPRA